MIFIDSSFFIALVDRKDQWHHLAKNLIPFLTNETIVISDLIIVESVSIIGRRSGGKQESIYIIILSIIAILLQQMKKLSKGACMNF
jgi:predicted nucleic acid-binding protein